MSKKKYRRKDYIWGYAMIAPLVLGLGVFYFYPVFKVFFDSFHDVGAFNKRKWCGLANYTKMLQDETMWQSLGNTCKYVLIIVPCTIIIAMILASLLNMNIKGRSVFRVIYFLPAITMSSVTAAVWKWMYNGDYGIINAILNVFGFEKVRFLTDSRLALLAICVVSIWSQVGYNMIIILAGMQGISKSYYEAASIDGAGKLKQFFKITVPLVTPTLFFVMVTLMISTFQIFDTVYMMIEKSGLALESAQSAVGYFYSNAFEYSKKGYASALAVVLFVIIMIITVIQMRAQSKWVNYD